MGEGSRCRMSEGGGMKEGGVGYMRDEGSCRMYEGGGAKEGGGGCMREVGQRREV